MNSDNKRIFGCTAYFTSFTAFVATLAVLLVTGLTVGSAVVFADGRITNGLESDSVQEQEPDAGSPTDEPQKTEPGTDENPKPDTREEEQSNQEDEAEEPAEEFEEWGHLTGKLILTGDIPEIADEAVDKDQATCITDGTVPKDDNLIVGENGGLKDVFVTLYKAESPEIHPSCAAFKETPVVLDNKNCRFAPHAAVVLTGQDLILKNSDDVGHNCHGVGFNNEFNINLATGSELTMVLDQAESSPMNITCDIHGWMDSVLMVRDDPYFAISAEDGTFTLANLPEGTWEIQFWHKRTANMKKLTVEGYEVGRKGQIEVTIIKGATVDLGEMTFDAADLKDR